MKGIIKIALTVLVALLHLPVLCHSAVRNLGSYGQTYSIVEPDALEELRQRAARIDWSKVFSKRAQEDKIKNFKPPNLPSLTRVERDRTFLVDLTYTLPFDIPDGKGGVLYPKGYSINPLDYVNYPRTLVIINGDDKDQVRWFKDSPYAEAIDVTLLITDGSYYELARKFKRPVFYLTAGLAHRLGIDHVPSVVRQRGRYMEVREVAITNRKKIAKD